MERPTSVNEKSAFHSQEQTQVPESYSTNSEHASRLNPILPISGSSDGTSGKRAVSLATINSFLLEELDLDLASIPLTFFCFMTVSSPSCIHSSLVVCSTYHDTSQGICTMEHSNMHSCVLLNIRLLSCRSTLYRSQPVLYGVPFKQAYILRSF